MQAFQIEDAWEKIMGKTVARYTDKLQVINDTLFITTQVAPLKQELIFQKEKIIQRVNEALGQRIINKIVVNSQAKVYEWSSSGSNTSIRFSTTS
jgi:Protein of unknown function (DUF721).